MILTDKDIKQLYATLPRFSIDEGEAQLRTAFEAQDKLSRRDEHRLVCEGLVEWLEGNSPDHPDGSSRRDCEQCMNKLIGALREGQVPGEEV